MACGGTTGSVQKRLTALSNSQAIEWFTGWVSCIGMDIVMPVLVARAASTNFFEAQIVIQVAKVRTDAPDLPVLKGGPQQAVANKIDYNPGVLNIAADTAGAMFIRFGVAYRFIVGQSQCAADVEMTVAYVKCGDLVGSGTWQLNPTTPIGFPQQQLLTGWIPSVLADKAKLAAICNSLTGNVQWRLGFRTAATQQSIPGPWLNVNDGNAPYGAGEVNTGDLVLSLGSNLWVQFAIMYWSSSNGQASFTAALGIRRT